MPFWKINWRLDVLQICFEYYERKTFHPAQIWWRTHLKESRGTLVLSWPNRAHRLRAYDYTFGSWTSRLLHRTPISWLAYRIFDKEGCGAQLALQKQILKCINVWALPRKNWLLSLCLQHARFLFGNWWTIQCVWPHLSLGNHGFKLLRKFSVCHGGQFLLPKRDCLQERCLMELAQVASSQYFDILPKKSPMLL